MKQRLLSIVLALCMVFALLPVTAAANGAAPALVPPPKYWTDADVRDDAFLPDGDDVPDVIEIETAAELGRLAYLVNADYEFLTGKTVLLTHAIDLDGALWAPFLYASGFTFDGQNHSVANMRVTDVALFGGDYNAGLFGYVTDRYGSAVIENLDLSGGITLSVLDASAYVGGLVGYGEADRGGVVHIENVHTDVDINLSTDAYAEVGGIAGGLFEAGDTIINCSARGDISVTGEGSQSVGGLVGYLAKSSLLNSFYHGSIVVSDSDIYVGGLAGQNWRSTLDNCYIAGALNGTAFSDEFVGKDHDEPLDYPTCYLVTAANKEDMLAALNANAALEEDYAPWMIPSDLINGGLPIHGVAHSHPTCGATCSHTTSGEGVTPVTYEHAPITFTPVVSGSAMPAAAGSYYLTQNVTLTDAWSVPDGTTTLCLGGFTIKSTHTAMTPIIELSGSGNLNICDCQSGGKVDGEDHIGITNGGSGVLTLYGGTINSGVVSDENKGSYGVLNGSTGQVVVDGGTVVSAHKQGAVMCNSSTGSIEIKSGGVDGSGVNVGIGNDSEGAVAISGGTVSAVSFAITNNAGALSISGGTAISQGGGTVNLSGDAVINGAISCYDYRLTYFGSISPGVLNISGSPEISSATGHMADIYLYDGRTITIAGALTNATPYRVYKDGAAAGAIIATATTAAHADASKFTAANTGYSLAANATESGGYPKSLYLVANTYAVNLPATQTGYTLAAKEGSGSPVTHGGSYTFTFALDAAYSNSTPVIKVGGATVTLTNGEYTITNITGEQTIIVEGVTQNTPSGGHNHTPPQPRVAYVLVDGQAVDAGAVTVDTKRGETTTLVDQSVLAQRMAKAEENVTVIVPPGSNTATAQLVVANLDELAEKNMSLTIQTGDISYDIPAGAVDTAALREAFPNVKPEDIPFIVTIARAPQSRNDAVNSAAVQCGGGIALPAIDFTITTQHNGKTVEVEAYEKYTARVVEITLEQAQFIATAVVYQADGSLRHAPTKVYSRDGKWYAKVNSLTDSTYALIWNQAYFADAEGKWYKAVAAEMASRRIILGRDTGMFDGGANITRAELAAIVGRALALPDPPVILSEAKNPFSDVPEAAWYFGAVGAAYEYGLIEGRGNGIFDPLANVTREETMAIIARAARITGFTGMSGELGAFIDADKVSPWAVDAARWSVGSGLIVGANGLLRPGASISRAEASTIVLRLLQKSDLVDVRNEV